jgi:CRISPR-associated protein (TIGR03986 family)
MPRDSRTPSRQPARPVNRSAQVESASLCETPYHFVPINPALAVAAEPVFHDVQQTSEGFWSGELHCTLEALTPLIAGNYQYDYQFLADDLKARYQKLLADRRADGTVVDDKKLIEPLCMEPTNIGLPGTILIAGEAIKGMVRQSLQALLSAPMERVQERTFSFRPNLADAENMVPAIVHRRDIRDGRLVSMEVEFAGACDDILYVRGSAIPVLQRWLERNGYPEARSGLDRLPIKAPRADINAEVSGLRIDTNPRRRYARKLDRGSETYRENLRYYTLVRYRGGLDGQATFASVFNGRTTVCYRWALVPLRDEKPQLVALPQDVLANYSDTLEHIGDDQTGHLLAHPYKGELNQVRDTTMPQFRREYPQVGDMLFVEMVNGKVVGIGHHFRHRRRYRDTVHLSRDPQVNRRYSTQALGLRDILSPSLPERTIQASGTHHGAPQKLTGARLMFGFVGADRPKYDLAYPNESLTFGIGEGDFKQLAGRISINWAVEQGALDRDGRFLNQGDYGCLVPLRPLGAPKPSAVETYLTQDCLGDREDLGTLCTYGDTPDDPAAGNLRGRKFYLHQPLAAESARCYELLDTDQPDWKSGETLNLRGNQAVIARFVSKPDTTFKFTLRFRDLRFWELGALLFTLTADQALIEHLARELQGQENTPGLQSWLQHIPEWKVDDTHPLLALKLGHGRPLGLGSIRIRVDSFDRLVFNPDGMPSLQSCSVEEGRR